MSPLLRTSLALAATFALQCFAVASPPLGAFDSNRGYWLFLTTPVTLERPLIGICDLGWWKGGAVQGFLRFDTEDCTDPKRFPLDCDVSGTNAETGKLNLSLRILSPPKSGVRGKDELGRYVGPTTPGAELLKGILTKRVQGSRITWSGKLRVVDKNTLLSRLGRNGLRTVGLSELPTEWDVTMIGFAHLQIASGVGGEGLYPTSAVARWLPERDKEAQQWLKAHRIQFFRREGVTDRWFLELPPFDQNLTVYRMLRTEIFEEVARSGFELSSEATYSIACPQSVIFNHPPASAEGVAEALAFTQKFVADTAALPRFHGVRFSEPVVVRTHRFQFSLIGLSSAISNGPKGYWDRTVLELGFSRELGQSIDEMSIDLTVAEAVRAKGPASVEPPRERFGSDPGISSSNILKVLGTQLGPKVKATRQFFLDE